jgi:hypothetical protein
MKPKPKQRKREQRPIQLDKNDHEALKEIAGQVGLGMGTVVHRLIRSLAIRVVSDEDVPEPCYLPKFAIFELLHMRECGFISAEEFSVLVNNPGAEGIVLDMVWVEDYREKKEILDRFDIIKNKFV